MTVALSCCSEPSQKSTYGCHESERQAHSGAFRGVELPTAPHDWSISQAFDTIGISGASGAVADALNCEMKA